MSGLQPRSTFLSYARADSIAAREKARHLSQCEVEVLLDPESLRGGDRWPDSLAQSIRGCDRFTLLWSRAAAQSAWVSREIAEALCLMQRLDLAHFVSIDRLDDTPLPAALAGLETEATSARRVAMLLDGEFADFDTSEARRLRGAIAGVYGLEAESVQVLEQRAGSVRLELGLPAEAADWLLLDADRAELALAVALHPWVLRGAWAPVEGSASAPDDDSAALIAAADLGSRHIRVAVAEPGASVTVRGLALRPSRGLRRGKIVDPAAVSAVLDDALQELEAQTGQKIASLRVNAADPQLASVTGQHAEALDGPVTPRVAQAALGKASDLPLEEGREILRIIPLGYTLDDAAPTRDPVGERGRIMGAHVLAATVNSEVVPPLLKALADRGRRAEALLPAPWVAALATTTAEERAQGVCVLDIGAETTEVAVFFEGGPMHLSTIAVGGQNLAHDIAIGLRVPTHVAEALLRARAHVLPEDPQEPPVDIPALGDAPGRRVGAGLLREVVVARVEELLSLAGQRIDSVTARGRLEAGLVLTGGTAQLPGLTDAAERALDMPARLGREATTRTGLRGPQLTLLSGLLTFDALPESSAWETQIAARLLARFQS